MIATDCPDCGEPLARFAKSCPHCGAPNAARRAGFVIAASLVLLIAAIGIAALAIVRWQRLPIETEGPATATTDDFGWLKDAMKTCDDEAAGTPSTLHFLVIPLSAAPEGVPQWKSKSLNDVGNAIALPSQEALDALTGGMLKISPDPYFFRVHDDATKTILEWSLSTGVKRFSAPDTDAIQAFKLQFMTRERTGGDNWGATFARRKGNCNWVNAIIGNQPQSPR
jgi:hypothetical protein